VEGRRSWTAEEVELIDQILDGKLAKYQVAAKTGRTRGSVQKKCEKRAKEREREKQVAGIEGDCQ
jgi:uncharacterized protein YdbL (DUF1318 family)